MFFYYEVSLESIGLVYGTLLLKYRALLAYHSSPLCAVRPTVEATLGQISPNNLLMERLPVCIH